MNLSNISTICKNGKLNKLETIKEAIETINKLVKREQQLSYIRKLLSMWNHKLVLCDKVTQKDVKPEAIKVVSDVMKSYKTSVCYKVGEALEKKSRELQHKRAQLLSNGMTTYSLQENKTLCNSSPVTNSVQIPVPVIPFKVPIKRIH
ncbi:unnamed protein product, partial [Oppiella nova]